LPFNGQFHESDLRRKYKVPNPRPRPLPEELNEQLHLSPELTALKESYDEFIEVYNRSTIRVVIPQDRQILDRIHKTIEYVLREGPVFEAIIIARENGNPDYKFLYDNYCFEHVYYRWKLFSLLHGDDPYKWKTDEFRMFEGGPIWKPPPLNPFADGMPVELIEKSTGVQRELLLSDKPLIPSGKNSLPGLDVQSTVRLHLNLADTRQKGSLGPVKRLQFDKVLEELRPTKSSIGSAMTFCINHSDAAQEVIDCICIANEKEEVPLARKVALVFLISDVLHNCSAAVTNASFYRKGFQAKLESIFENLSKYLDKMMRKNNGNDQQKADPKTSEQSNGNSALAQQRIDMFKHKILSTLGAWREWALYEDEFIIKLSNILLGITHNQTVSTGQGNSSVSIPDTCAPSSFAGLTKNTKELEKNLDGEPLADEILVKCLEEKGLSLRWYKTLELSDDENDDSGDDAIQSRAETESVEGDG